MLKLNKSLKLILGLGADDFASLVQKARSFSQTSEAFARAAILKNFGEPLVIEETKSKTLGKSQVKVKIHYCGVNASDLLICNGLYENKPNLPCTPGFEFSGEVLEVGNKVKDVHKGDRVLCLNKDDLGGFSQECCVHEKDIWKVPNGIDFKIGASFLDSYSTALIAFNRRAKVKPNETVLITAAAGGLGLAAVDLAANVYKAKVIAVCSTEDKASLVRDKGAFSAIKYDRKNLIKKVNEITSGKGVNTILDAVGGDIFETALECVAHEGEIIVAGFASRKIPTISTSELLPKSCALIGISLGHYRTIDPEYYRQTVQDVIELYSMGLISPHISGVFPLDDINSALKYIEDRKSTGKVVVEMNPDL